MHLVFLDLVPLLMSWEGRAAHEDPEIPPGAAEMLDEVFADYRIAGIADGAFTGLALRQMLEDAGLDIYFDFIGTSLVGNCIDARPGNPAAIGPEPRRVRFL